MDLDRIAGFYAPQTWHPASNPSGGRHRLRKLVILPTLLGPLVQEESPSSTTFFPVKNGERERERERRRRGLIGLLCMTTGSDHKSPSPQPVIGSKGRIVSWPKALKHFRRYARVLERPFCDGIVFGRCPILVFMWRDFWPTNMHDGRRRRS